ncbi:MAG TPA: DUF2884 family protein [Gammaproteobacteria bacterium]|nr:DUF2884 family protein [Gammaproteobacteria bacterium]
MKPIKPLLVLTLALALPFAATTAQADTNLFSHDGHGVELNDDGVAFHIDGKPDAYAYNDGRVRIDGDQLDLSDEQRAQVRKYVRQLRQLRDQALEIGLNAAHFALDTAWAAVVGALTDGDVAEERIESRADEFEDKVIDEICTPIGQVHESGKKLVADVEALKDYVPETETREECIEDANDDD